MTATVHNNSRSAANGPSTGVIDQTVSNRKRRSYDGVICFGGVDWWYHNRGHYDLQMMREFSRDLPVLYVNSMGMRMPRPGRSAMFMKRIARKLRSLQRGLVRVRPRFGVYSPLAIPGRSGRRITRWFLPWQVRRAANAMGIYRPLVWVACPPAIDVVDKLHPVGVVYQRTDRFEAFRGVDSTLIRSFDRRLKERADITLYCSTSLYGSEAGQCRQALFVDHGVDYVRFAAAGTNDADEPTDVRMIVRPRIGFVGGIDAHTFDPELFLEAARSRPEYQFVLVGACSLPEGWCTLANVHLLGQRPYDEVASYMAACDVLIMPWNGSDWIKACNPVKLKEYLAVGRPVVSTPFDELDRYRSFVNIAHDARSFAEAIDQALANPGDATVRRKRVERETWTVKAQLVVNRLGEHEIVATIGDSHSGIPPLELRRTVEAADTEASPGVVEVDCS